MNIQKESQKSKRELRQAAEVGGTSGRAVRGKYVLISCLVVIGGVGSLGIVRWVDDKPSAVAEVSDAQVASLPGEVIISSSTEEKASVLNNKTKPSKAGFVATTSVNSGQTTAVNSMKNSMNSATKTFIASKNGHIFYDASCSQVKKIKNANRISFFSAAAALAAGYQPSKPCKSSKKP